MTIVGTVLFGRLSKRIDHQLLCTDRILRVTMLVRKPIANLDRLKSVSVPDYHRRNKEISIEI